MSVLAPKLEHQFGSEQQENNTAKLTATELAVSTPPAPRSNQKRKSGGDGAKTSNRAAVKKPKTEPVSHFFRFHSEHVKFKVYNHVTVKSHQILSL